MGLGYTTSHITTSTKAGHSIWPPPEINLQTIIGWLLNFHRHVSLHYATTLPGNCKVEVLGYCRAAFVGKVGFSSCQVSNEKQGRLVV